MSPSGLRAFEDADGWKVVSALLNDLNQDPVLTSGTLKLLWSLGE